MSGCGRELSQDGPATFRPWRISPTSSPREAAEAIERLERERDEADRRAGAAERRIAPLEENARASQRWLDDAKQARGYERGDTFDRVWDDTCAAADRAIAAEAKLSEMRSALERQCDNMAFIVNHASLYGWHDKFVRELEEDRRALGDKP